MKSSRAKYARNAIFMLLFGIIIPAIVLLQIFGGLREQQFSARAPLTMRDLDRIASDMNSVPVEQPAGLVPVPETAAMEPRSIVAQQQGTEKAEISNPARPLPKRLERALTLEERTRFLNTTKAGRVIAPFVDVGLRMADVVAAFAINDKGAAWERAQAALGKGDWDFARKCFEVVAEKSEEPMERRDACAYLAWLEDDPEMAARYMELACSGKGDLRGGCEGMSASLAATTGSMELARYYSARLGEVIRLRREEERGLRQN